MDHLPLFAPELLQTLDQMFPEKAPDPKDSDCEVWLKAGERRLINTLLAFENEQYEPHLASGLSVDPGDCSPEDLGEDDDVITEDEEYEPLSSHLPFVSSRLIRMMDFEYPERPRDPSESDRDVWLRAGERRLIEFLKGSWEIYHKQHLS